jgi:hypothetical protein
MRIAITLAALLAAGCGGAERVCGPRPAGVTSTGDVPARHLELVLRVAQGHCPRPIAGTLRWASAVAALGCGSRPGEVIDGCLHPESCWLDAEVENVWGDAVYSALPHELGHYCLGDTRDEAAADAFGEMVQDEVFAALAAGAP